MQSNAIFPARHRHGLTSIGLMLVCLCMPTYADAQTVLPVDFAVCKGIGDDAQRLKCFDGLTTEPAQAAVTPTKAPTVQPACGELPRENGDAETRIDCVADSGDKIQKRKSWDADARAIMNDNMEATYITFGSGRRLGNDQTSASMLYEAQIFKNISFNDDAPWARLGQKWWLDIPVRIGLRQLTDSSKPVRTPTFNPGARLFWTRDTGDEVPKTPITYYSVGLHHYSNGQDGASTSARTGEVNTRSGSFNTNYLEAAAHWAGGMGPIQWVRLGVRQHFYGTFETFQNGQYPRRELLFEARTRPLFKNGPLPMQLRLAETYRSGFSYVIKNDVFSNQSVYARTRDRLHTTAEWIVRPNLKDSKLLKWRDLGMYVRYDYGHDYYNINFQHRINRLQVGVITTNF